MQAIGGHQHAASCAHPPARGGLELEAAGLRVPAGLMLAAAFVLARLPGHVGLVCPLRALTGIPCPLCGMTTSVVATVDLRWSDALAATPAGMLLVVAAVAVLAVRRPVRLRIPMVVGIGALGAMWLFQLFRFQVL